MEIYPPDLRADGLPAALNDLVAPAENTGVSSSVTVADLDGVSEESVALVWRVAQEAVRNAVRHASPTASTSRWPATTARSSSRSMTTASGSTPPAPTGATGSGCAVSPT